MTKASQAFKPLGQEIDGLLVQTGLTYEQAVALAPADRRISPGSLKHYRQGSKVPGPGNREKLDALLHELRLVAAGKEVQPAALKTTRGLFLTELARNFLSYVDYAWERRTEQVYLLSAIAGAGKTTVADYWQRHVRSHPYFYLEVPAPSCSAGQLVHRLHTALKLEPVTLTYRRQDQVIAHLRAHPMMLIFDQAEELTLSALNALQYLWDQTKAAMLLLATPALLYRLQIHTSGARNIGRLRTRIFHAPLPPPSPEEVAAVAQAICGRRWGPGAFALFYRQTGSGCLRQVISAAHAINQVMRATPGVNGRDPITTKVLQVALRHLL